MQPILICRVGRREAPVEGGVLSWCCLFPSPFFFVVCHVLSGCGAPGSLSLLVKTPVASCSPDSHPAITTPVIKPQPSNQSLPDRPFTQVVTLATASLTVFERLFFLYTCCKF